jgi:hypothetical protein
MSCLDDDDSDEVENFCGHPFLAFARAVANDAVAVFRKERLTLVTCTQRYVREASAYLAATKLGPYARAGAMHGLMALSVMLRKVLCGGYMRSELGTLPYDEKTITALAEAQHVLEVFADEAELASESGFVSGPSPLHASICTWASHNDFLWCAESLALAVAVDLVEPGCPVAIRAVAATMHEDDWAKVYAHLEVGAGDCEFSVLVRAAVLMRASLPNVTNTARWVTYALDALTAFNGVLEAYLPQKLRVYLVENVVQVVHFWGSCESRARHRDALALLQMIGPQDMEAVIFQNLWCALLCRQVDVMVPMFMPALWTGSQCELSSLGMKAFVVGEQEPLRPHVGAGLLPMIVHGSRCLTSDCTCGAAGAGAACIALFNAHIGRGTQQQVDVVLAEHPLASALTCVPLSRVKFVGPMWVGAAVDECVAYRQEDEKVVVLPPSDLQRVLFCVGDTGAQMPSARFLDMCGDVDDDGVPAGVGVPAGDCVPAGVGVPVAWTSDTVLPSCRAASVCSGKAVGRMRVRGGRACGFRARGKPKPFAAITKSLTK